MMMSDSVLKRKNVAKIVSFTGININILKEEIMQGSKCCTSYTQRGIQCRDAVMMMSGPSGVRLAGGGAFLWFAALCQNSHASNFCIF